VAVVVPEAIVFAGESRQTQIVGGVNRVASDNAMKVFDLTDTVLAATAGWAFLRPAGTAMQRNISSIIDTFKATIPARSSVKDIATSLWSHFNDLYQQHIAQIPGSAVAAGSFALSLAVGGYDAESPDGTLYSIQIPSTTPPPTSVRSTDTPGPWWIGQVDVVSRILKGYDYRALELPFIKAALQDDNNRKLLGGLEYPLFSNTMTVQDAIDFAVAMIQVTITMQRFTAGTVSQLGSIAGVGGPIDIAVVHPRQKIRWVSRKELHP
jgi:20S proteasome alpha/beta subunit